MPRLDILTIAADDVRHEKREALRVIAEVDRSSERLELHASLDAAPSAPPDLALIVVWSEADAALEAALDAASGAARTWVFVKTAAVEVDLADRASVLARLERKAALDALLDARSATWRRIPFETPAGFSAALERELRDFLAARHGLGGGAPSLRPTPGDGYLARSRLLERLPDAAGHVVLLEAPYGYGKSVLAAQWADRLEEDEWRVVWLARSAGADLRPLVVGALGIAAATPDALVVERLWEAPTLLVLEDLEGDEDLAWLLDDVRGLLLLASREPLRDERLGSLLAAGGATRLGAEDLAFTAAEAVELVGDEAAASELHEATLGWSLPLHVASLTGSAPDAASLVAGIRASLDEPGWRELLLLAALPYLPQASATADTAALASKGFVQRLEASYRLHPYIREVVFSAFRDEVAETVRRERERLPWLLRGVAFERCRDFEQLVQVLEAAEAELWRQDPARLVAWDAAIPGLRSPRRDWSVGAALGRLQDFAGAIARLGRALDSDGLGADERLGIMRELCTSLAVADNARGRELVRSAEPLLEQATPEPAGRFLTNAALVYAHGRDFEAAIETSGRALAYLPESSPYRLAPEINEALFRYDLHGDYDHRLDTQIGTLARTEATYPVQALGQCRDIGMMCWWLGDTTRAVAYLERARDGERINPAIGLEARAALAYLEGDEETVYDVARAARPFGSAYVHDIVSMYAVAQALDAGDHERARHLYETGPRGPFATCARARALAAEERTAEAVALLDGLGDVRDRNTRLYVTSTRYLVTRDEAHLATFLALTTAGPRLLPGFVPIEALPGRPELTAHYPIGEVLASGRKEAVRYRHDDIPALELRLLGEASATLLETPLGLSDRQTQLLVLLALGLSRSAAAEAMWPEAEPKKQRNNLNVQLNGLRRAIEPWGVATYLFEDGLRRVASDHGRLVAALASGDAATVYALYREPLAPGVDLAPVEEERARLRGAVTTLLLEAAAAAPREEVRYLARALELEPLDESVLQALLKALVRRGRRREAWRRFTAFADTLREEMGLEPLEETQRILGA